MKKFIPVFLVIAFACQSSQESEVSTLKDEVMAIHDEVMPKMGELRSVRKSLMFRADSLTGIDSVSASMLNSLADDIGNASEGMMQWMRAYEPDFEGTEEEVKAYLEAQKASIQQVKEEMESSLEKGQMALDKE